MPARCPRDVQPVDQLLAQQQTRHERRFQDKAVGGDDRGVVDGRRCGQIMLGGFLEHAGQPTWVTLGDIDEVAIVDRGPQRRR